MLLGKLKMLVTVFQSIETIDVSIDDLDIEVNEDFLK